MLVSKVLDKYLEKYPIYNLINFSIGSKGETEKLHPLFILTQHIIDQFISKGCKRIAIVLPEEDCNILPLILVKYFSNIVNEPNYAGSVLDDIKPGQHIRLGKAVVEYIGIDDSNRIIFKTGRTQTTTVGCPINGIHYLFEKTDAAVSSFETWRKARDEAQAKLDHWDSLIASLKTKRTVLRQTILLLSAKNDFKEFADVLKINGQSFDDILAYGEIDLEEESKFKLYNKGKLNCLPSIAVTAKTEDLYYLLKEEAIKESIFAIFSTIEKFDEVTSNPDTLRRMLKQDIPFIIFVPETGFETCPLLKEYGFEMWHWSPSTMKSDALLVENKMGRIEKQRTLFGRFAEKINRAALSDFTIETSYNKGLRKSLRLISRLSQQTNNADNTLRQLVRKMWALQNKLTWLLCKIEGRVYEELSSELLDICNVWTDQRRMYCGQSIEKSIEEVIRNFHSFLSEAISSKLVALEKYLSGIATDKLITIIVPNKYDYAATTSAYLISRGYNVRVQKLSDFYSSQEINFITMDYLIVTWFDKDEYLRLKQSYCYDHLVFVLYDYESKWRERYITRVYECIPHDSVIRTANYFGFSQEDFYDKPFDRVFTSENEELKEVADYNISSSIIRSTFGNNGVELDGADSLECIPVVLSEDKIAYFYSTHEVIDVTALSRGDSNIPNKKEAKHIKKGDKILIRQSDKDIIREIADTLMAQQGETELRGLSEIWFDMLSVYAVGKTIDNVCDALKREGGDCTWQQVRYWLSGETIMPRDKSVLIAIGIVASSHPDLKGLSEQYLNSIDEIFNAGRKVQNYHQKAGFQLTMKLKSKAQDIKAISNSSIHRGIVSGIGEIQVYTVEDVLGKEMIGRNHINRVEDLY